MSFMQPQTSTGVMHALKTYGAAPGPRTMMLWEFEHAEDAISAGIYVTFINKTTKTDCFRLGKNSRCHCGHMFPQHQKSITKKLIKTNCEMCSCAAFSFMPRRPEEVGFWHLPRRKGFNVTTWRPPCKCKHTNEDHKVNPPLRCSIPGCSCRGFDSNFTCQACESRWEEHETVYELERDRMVEHRPVREDYLPLAQDPEIQQEFLAQVRGNKKPKPEEGQEEFEIVMNPNRREDEPLVTFAARTNLPESQLRPKQPRGRGLGIAQRPAQEQRSSHPAGKGRPTR